jgi:hypothetical protein
MDTMTLGQKVRVAANPRYTGTVIEVTSGGTAGYVDVVDSRGEDEPQPRTHFHASELIEDES